MFYVDGITISISKRARAADVDVCRSSTVSAASGWLMSFKVSTIEMASPPLQKVAAKYC